MSTILVTGDFLVDHHIYQGRRHHFGDLSSPGVCVKEELGGGALIHRLLSKLGLNAHWKSILAVEEDEALQKMRECISPGSDCFDQQFSAYAFWRPYPLKKQAKKGEEMRWRVAEALGFGGGAVTSGQWPWGVSPKIPGAPEILVISDGGMGFRSRRNASNWRIPMPKERLAALFQADSAAEATPPPQEPRWVILKMSAPVAEGDLWRELSHHHADRLIVVVSAAELRRANVKLRTLAKIIGAY